MKWSFSRSDDSHTNTLWLPVLFLKMGVIRRTGKETISSSIPKSRTKIFRLSTG